MNDRIDERKVSRYLYEIAGRAGDICGYPKLQKESSPNLLDRDEPEPEYTKRRSGYI